MLHDIIWNPTVHLTSLMKAENYKPESSCVTQSVEFAPQYLAFLIGAKRLWWRERFFPDSLDKLTFGRKHDPLCEVLNLHCTINNRTHSGEAAQTTCAQTFFISLVTLRTYSIIANEAFICQALCINSIINVCPIHANNR